MREIRISARKIHQERAFIGELSRGLKNGSWLYGWRDLLKDALKLIESRLSATENYPMASAVVFDSTVGEILWRIH